MEITISKHAKERIRERFNCKKEKIEKVAKKAFYSKEKINKTFLERREFNGYKDSYFRVFCGKIFVFTKCQKKILLVTILNNENIK